MYWILNITITGLASFLFLKKWRGDFSPHLYWCALSLKIAAGLMVGWIFLSHYAGADTFSYFQKAKALTSQSFGGYVTELFTASNYETTDKPRVFFFTKILSLFVFISGGSYWITSIYLSLASFFASWWTVVRIHHLYPKTGIFPLTGFLFCPTIIFWSSGVLKDTIASSGLMVAVVGIISSYKLKKLLLFEALWILLSLFLLFKLRHYLLITLLLFAGLLFFIHFIKKSNTQSKLTAGAILLVSFFGVQSIHPFLNLKRLPLTLYENNQAIVQKTDPVDQLTINIEQPDWMSILNEVPEAIKTGLFRPSIFDPTIHYGWFHKIENLALTVCTILSLLIWMKEKPKVEIPIVVAASISILFLGTVLALSTPNFGTLVRYKNAFMPFYFLLVSILPYQYLASKRT